MTNFIKIQKKTNNLETVTCCRTQFNFDATIAVLKERSDTFVHKYKLCDSVYCTVVLNVAFDAYCVCWFFVYYFVSVIVR